MRSRGWRGTWLVVGAALLLLAAAPAAPERGSPPTPPRVRPGGTAPLLIIFDSSGSMRADDGTGRQKIDAAKEALSRLVDELPEGTPVGLRAYGHRVPNTDRAAGCADTELLVPVGPLDRGALRSAIGGLAPTGFTPIGAALEAALADLPAAGPRTVVLVSDGIDTCAPPDPCAVAGSLAEQAVELRVEAIGFQVDPAAAAQLACIADITGGRFRTVDDAGSLLRALREYQVVGSPVSGGGTPQEAPVLSSGQYRDTLVVGQERWYAVDLEEGEVLRTTATVVGARGGPVAAEAAVSLEVLTDDVLGALPCGRDEVLGVGQEALQVNIDGLDTTEIGICREPGRYAIRLDLTDPAGVRSVLAGRPFEVELLVSIVPSADAAAAVDAADAAGGPDAAGGAGVPGAGAGTGSGAGASPAEPPPYAAAGLGAGLLGLVAGAVVARRQGP
jgi:Ca-activated chloride channel family protein